jgi:hypothetical protein
MTTFWPVALAGAILLGGVAPARSVQLTVSRDVLERTLRQQLYSGQDGKYFLKGNAQTPCFISTEDPHLSFEQGRIVVRMKTQAKVGKQFGSKCIGIPLSLPTEVSLAPDADGETIGFKDARLDKIVDQKEVNFVLSPFLRGKVPSSMRVNAAELLRKALAGSTASSGYKVNLNRLRIVSIQVTGDKLIIDADGAIGVE